MISEFFCLSCSRTVYSRPDDTCPVCSSPLLSIPGVGNEETVGEIEADEIVVLGESSEHADPGDDAPPVEPTAVDQPHD